MAGLMLANVPASAVDELAVDNHLRCEPAGTASDTVPASWARRCARGPGGAVPWKAHGDADDLVERLGGQKPVEDEQHFGVEADGVPGEGAVSSRTLASARAKRAGGLAIRMASRPRRSIVVLRAP